MRAADAEVSTHQLARGRQRQRLPPPAAMPMHLGRRRLSAAARRVWLRVAAASPLLNSKSLPLGGGNGRSVLGPQQPVGGTLGKQLVQALQR